MAKELTDKVAVITGANSGFGEAIALLFASRGAKITLCGRDPDRLQSVFDQVVKISGGHKDNFLTVQGDVNQHNVRAEIVAKTMEKFGRLDILVPNAGINMSNAGIKTATEETYDLIMNTNLKSVFFLIQQSVPHLEKSKGCIIGISSVSSELVTPLGIYEASKAGLDHLFRCLALDLGPSGVRVNTVNPSYFPDTRILARGSSNDNAVDTTPFIAAEKSKQPLEGRLGKNEEVAELVAFLASDAAGFITGENIRVDGGRRFMGPISTFPLPVH